MQARYKIQNKRHADPLQKPKKGMQTCCFCKRHADLQSLDHLAAEEECTSVNRVKPIYMRDPHPHERPAWRLSSQDTILIKPRLKDNKGYLYTWTEWLGWMASLHRSSVPVLCVVARRRVGYHAKHPTDITCLQKKGGPLTQAIEYPKSMDDKYSDLESMVHK